MVLDVGSGSGILGMLAARAGADVVVGVELSSHMCEVADRAICDNQLTARCSVIQGDARRLFAATSTGLRSGLKPDGRTPELERQADVLVFEVFDAGLIGEGAIHLAALAKLRLLLPDALVVPAAARLFVQPIELRVGSVCGVNVEPLSRFEWRPDYEGLELGRMPGQWRPLAEPALAFCFDFASLGEHLQPLEKTLELTATSDGAVDAFAFWFELALDEHETLSTAPCAGKGSTWPNAVLHLSPAANVKKGEPLAVTVRHDTYSVTASVANAADVGAAQPLVDELWLAAHKSLETFNHQLVKQFCQNPLEYRRGGVAAVAMMSRPGDLGLDEDAGVAFGRRMMG
jgi:SAM-dependent methyltransferase